MGKTLDPPLQRSWEGEGEEELAERCLFRRLLTALAAPRGPRRTRHAGARAGRALAEATGSSCVGRS